MSASGPWLFENLRLRAIQQRPSPDLQAANSRDVVDRDVASLNSASTVRQVISGEAMRVVICGSGVIGACTAYFLSRRGIDVTVVERTEVAAAASGKAGGFLALDWCSGSPLDALAQRSFGLHAALPHEIAGDWGYRRMTAYSGFVVPERDARRHKPAKLDWLSEGVVIESRLGTTETTAIVHPRAFTAAMMGAALKRGAELRHGRVTGIVRTADGSTVRGVEVDDGVVESDAVVVAMGLGR
jgi:glycine/D-amino acid oxidase-like deaminating enzyme